MTSEWRLSTREGGANRWPDREPPVRAPVLRRARPPFAPGAALTPLSSAVYLNVTNAETYNVDHDRFCIKWTPHRSATSYRIKLHPEDRKSPRLLRLPAGELSRRSGPTGSVAPQSRGPPEV